MRKITKIKRIEGVLKDSPHLSPKEVSKETELPLGLVEEVIKSLKEKQ